ncbi:hypothetical protein SELMODRAFT_431583 [Selaginella moellendorffii]|uniref:GIY-YIG domain-containing protein n=1 Tax=Selaginella moellendorffii TaxID=88036 RepID=D8TD45_SELML|nr:hypothetical protein SELMODRAFT_431583 [Selaginella moellendorffii]
MLLEYVQNVQPEFMELFIQKAPQQVVEAMRKTVTNMLGTLPPQFFEITITTVAENLAQLMRHFRPPKTRRQDEMIFFGPEFESKVQKSQVQGSVLKWHKEDGPVAMDAVEYIEFLESEVEKLQQQLERGKVSGQNELLDYLKNLEPKNLQELTTSAGEDAVEAMNTFVQRLIRISDAAMLKRTATETSAKELARLLYWLMVVGYSIRNIEVRYDMERILGMPAKHPELPPGETIPSGSRYRLHNLPSKSAVRPGIYELGIVRPCSSSRKRKKKKRLHRRDVVAVYLGQAENVRQRLQSYGQGGSHLEGWTGLEKWLPEKRVLTQIFRQGPRLFSEIFARGYSLAFRWSATGSKESALAAEKKLLHVFDYAWNKGANGARRSLDVLTKLEMQSNVVCGTRSSIATRLGCARIFERRVGVRVELSKPKDRSEARSFRDVIRRLFGLSIDGHEDHRKKEGDGVRPDDARKTSSSRKVCKVRIERAGTGKLYGEVTGENGLKCGVVSKVDGVGCTRTPRNGRKRCDLHRRMRVIKL